MLLVMFSRMLEKIFVTNCFCLLLIAMLANKHASEIYRILDQNIGLKEEVMEILKQYDDCMRQDGMKFKKDFKGDFLDELNSFLER